MTAPNTPLQPEIVDFLRAPKPSFMATVSSTGQPMIAATWYLLEPDERILINLKATRLRLSHLRREPRFALDVVDTADWYRHVALQLEVDSIEDDPELVGIDALARHYTGEPYADRESARVSVRARITHSLLWG